MKVNDKGFANVLVKMYKQLQEAEFIRKDQLLPSQTSINIERCKSDIETLLEILEFEK